MLEDRLSRLVAHSGPISVAHYMAEANAHYYATRDPLGAQGDFITAPEISQMFGELVGLCLADAWLRAGRPAAHYVEMGPGRGTLAVDALRAMRSAGLEPPVHFVETSPALREAQASRVPQAAWHDDAASLPEGEPLLIVANEFFDALPIRQMVRIASGWHEMMVGHEDGRFVRKAGPATAAPSLDAPLGTIVETSPASIAVVREIALRLAHQGGVAIIIDYGAIRSGTGDTLQAVERHGFADPWERPGERDLTAHVDFEALGAAAATAGAVVLGPVTQGGWLRALGIDARAGALAAAAPARAEEIRMVMERLTAADQMGELFKVMALVAPGWPRPAGFA